MYLKDKNKEIHVRLNNAQYEFLKVSADSIGVSPSAFLRIIITQVMNMREVDDSEDKTINFNDKL